MSPAKLREDWDRFLSQLHHYHLRFPVIFKIYHSLVARANEPSTLEHNLYASCLLTGKEHLVARAQQLPPVRFIDRFSFFSRTHST